MMNWQLWDVIVSSRFFPMLRNEHRSKCSTVEHFSPFFSINKSLKGVVVVFGARLPGGRFPGRIHAGTRTSLTCQDLCGVE